MTTYNPANWFWIGQPTGQSSVIIYSSAANAVVTSTGGAPATAWPSDATGEVTVAALDEVLISAIPPQPPTGLIAPSLASLQAALVAAASAACAAVTGQIYTDPSHQAAGQNAGVIVAAAGGAPVSSSPFFAAFNTYAAAWGLAPAAFATLIEVLMNESMVLSSALNALEAASAAATSGAQLATALATFETAINAVVVAINAAGTPFPMTAPAAIAIKGINA